MRLKFQERNELKFASRIIPGAKRRGIWKRKWNWSREAEDNATSREVLRIPPPAGAGEFQVAGLICHIFIVAISGVSFILPLKKHHFLSQSPCFSSS